jgi:hypothetical protein
MQILEMRTRPLHQPWFRGACALLFVCLGACKARRLSEELPATDTHGAAEQNAAEQALTGSAGRASNQLPPAPGAPGERPSVDQNMGRGFQGTLALRVRKASGGAVDLRYLSLGNTARLQLDSSEAGVVAGAPVHLDALIWGESLTLMDHQRRSLSTFPLRQIRPGDEPAPKVAIQKTGERSSLQGVFCERYVIQDGPLHVDAWVSGLPGKFDIDKLEAVSRLDVPAWVEELVKEDLLPLSANARDDQGRERYTLELVQYSAGPVDPELLSAPDNYRREAEPPQPVSSARAPQTTEMSK